MTNFVFVPADFKAAYPAFTGVSDAALNNYFEMATLYLSNSDCSQVQNIQRRGLLFFLLVAHIAQLSGALSANGSTPAPVGRASSATEGSVSIGLDFIGAANAAWFNQTQYGAMFWQATLSMRLFRYFPKPTVY